MRPTKPTTSLDVRTIEDHGQIPADLDTAILRTLAACYPEHRDMFARTRHWRGHIAAYRVIALDGGIVAAHVAVVDCTIRVGEASVRVAGVGQVAALPPYRKTGLIDRLLARAVDEAKDRGFDIGMLFCQERVRRVYERNGWIDITGRPCTRTEAGERILMPPDHLRMMVPLAMAELPPGPIDLGGDKW